MKNSLTMLAASVLLAGGCTSVNTTSTMQPRSNVDTVQRITNAGLSEKVHFEAAILDTDGPAHMAQVTVRNTSNDPMGFCYRFEWFNSSQVVVGQGEQTWRKATIQGGETMALTSVATARDATDFRLAVRPDC